jgi:predicted TIM-barrel fold metal-dependent hydrolase
VNTRADLPAWIAATRRILDGLSHDDAAAVAHRTAERVYGVALPAPARGGAAA